METAALNGNKSLLNFTNTCFNCGRVYASGLKCYSVPGFAEYPAFIFLRLYFARKQFSEQSLQQETGLREYLNILSKI